MKFLMSFSSWSCRPSKSANAKIQRAFHTELKMPKMFRTHMKWSRYNSNHITRHRRRPIPWVPCDILLCVPPRNSVWEKYGNTRHTIKESSIQIPEYLIWQSIATMICKLQQSNNKLAIFIVNYLYCIIIIII